MTKTIYLNNEETNYTIDEFGTIINTTSGKNLKGTITEHGYKKIMFSHKGKKIGKYLHRLMAIYFLNFDETSSQIINHKDGNKLNNCLENLEVLSASENLQHAYQNNLRYTNKDKKCDLYQGDEEGEEWVVIPNYPDYEISNKGRVKSFKYRHPIILKQDIRCGYRSVVLSNNGKTKHFQVHELVYFSFTKDTKVLEKVLDHIDGNKLNNKLDNLRYISQQENLNAALYEQKLTNKCKPVSAYKNGQFIKNFPSIAAASIELGVDNSAISKICKGIGKTVHGYSFEYLE